MIRAAALFAVLLATPASADQLPINPDVTQATIGATICRAGWTRTIRPAHGRMRRIKRATDRMIAAWLHARARELRDEARESDPAELKRLHEDAGIYDLAAWRLEDMEQRGMAS